MITKPTLLLDKNKCKANIAAMQQKAKKNNAVLRPHFKTHQSLAVGHWFREVGVEKITVSSLNMAVYFAEEWTDITVAFPVNILEIDTINDLANRIQLNLLVESVESIVFLAKYIKSSIGLFIKIDVGTHRTGVHPETAMINPLLQSMIANEKLVFKGFLAHAGHSYSARSVDEILVIHNTTTAIMSKLKAQYIAKYPEMIISVGDTPTCSRADDFMMIDEMRPGNFAFYDLMQAQICACDENQIAVAVACPIVAIHAIRNEMVIYGGGIHFSKDRIEEEEKGQIFGKVVADENENWGDVIDGMYLKKISQEHGIIKTPSHLIHQYKVGDIVKILPVHSCMTADLMKEYWVTTEKRIIEMF